MQSVLCCRLHQHSLRKKKRSDILSRSSGMEDQILPARNAQGTMAQPQRQPRPQPQPRPCPSRSRTFLHVQPLCVCLCVCLRVCLFVNVILMSAAKILWLWTIQESVCKASRGIWTQLAVQVFAQEVEECLWSNFVTNLMRYFGQSKQCLKTF